MTTEDSRQLKESNLLVGQMAETIDRACKLSNGQSASLFTKEVGQSARARKGASTHSVERIFQALQEFQPC